MVCWSNKNTFPFIDESFIFLFLGCTILSLIFRPISQKNLFMCSTIFVESVIFFAIINYVVNVFVSFAIFPKFLI